MNSKTYCKTYCRADGVGLLKCRANSRFIIFQTVIFYKPQNVEKIVLENKSLRNYLTIKLYQILLQTINLVDSFYTRLDGVAEWVNKQTTNEILLPKSGNIH